MAALSSHMHGLSASGRRASLFHAPWVHKAYSNRIRQSLLWGQECQAVTHKYIGTAPSR